MCSTYPLFGPLYLAWSHGRQNALPSTISEGWYRRGFDACFFVYAFATVGGAAMPGG